MTHISQGRRLCTLRVGIGQRPMPVRDYDPTLGRFVSADTIVPELLAS